MLAPETRALLTDALQPPAGARLDLAVATTFSLDLTALLLAPMSFALHETAQDIDQIDPIALLEALRRYADRTTVLCQAGGIHLPPKFSPLLQFLEDSVIAVRAPTPRRIFHPKVWVLRFRGLDDSALHRVLVLSRNLTFDRCWDTMLRLDEDTDKQSLVDVSPLADFVVACAGMTTGALTTGRAAHLHDMASTLRGAQLALPPGFTSLRFVPFGVGGDRWSPPAAADRALLISPFLDAGAVHAASAAARVARFLSRAESFDRVGPELFDSEHTAWTFQRAAEVEVGDDPGPVLRVASEWARVRDGLHAKTFVFEHGRQATVLTGSANLTTAALDGNVELSVELTGPASQCGIDAVWNGTAEAPGLSKLTEQYTPGKVSVDDATRTALELDIDAFHRELGAASFRAQITAGEHDQVEVRLAVPAIASPGDTMIWPISLDRIRARAYSPGVAVTWTEQSRRTITPFFAVETVVAKDGVTVTMIAVVKGELAGDVGNRRLDTMAAILKDSADVLRYLGFLLSDPRLDTSAATGRGAGEDGFFGNPLGSADMVLLEPLLRATVGDGAALERVASLVAEIESMPDSDRLMPEGFRELWDAVAQVRRG